MFIYEIDIIILLNFIKFYYWTKIRQFSPPFKIKSFLMSNQNEYKTTCCTTSFVLWSTKFFVESPIGFEYVYILSNNEWEKNYPTKRKKQNRNVSITYAIENIWVDKNRSFTLIKCCTKACLVFTLISSKNRPLCVRLRE